MTPPLPSLSDEELGRYARHIILREVGGAGQTRLKAASVLVIGAGGIGAPAIQYLAAAGIGRMVLVDDDVVDASNLARQVIYADADRGSAKVAAAAAAVARLNPHVAVDPRRERIDASNAPAMPNSGPRKAARRRPRPRSSSSTATPTPPA